MFLGLVLLELFSNRCSPIETVQGDFFLRKKPLAAVASVYSNWRTAIVSSGGGELQLAQLEPIAAVPPN
jgi:hypothetical protein